MRRKRVRAELRAREKTWERGCHLEYSINGKELGWISLRQRKKKYVYKYPDLASTPFRIHSVLKDFHSGENSSTLELPVLKERL